MHIVTALYANQNYEVKNSVVTKYYFAGSTRLAARTGGTLRFLLSDHLGSSSVTTDANGQTIGESLYKAFGETRYTLNNLYTDYHFTGQREQSELGIYWFQSRWYDGSLGRFLSPDTIVPTSTQGTQAWDRYAFVNNNPVRYTDPTGHRYCDYINSQNQEDCEAGQSRFDSSPKGSANENSSEDGGGSGSNSTKSGDKKKNYGVETNTQIPQSEGVCGGAENVSYCINPPYETLQIATGDGYRTITIDLNNVDVATLLTFTKVG